MRKDKEARAAYMKEYRQRQKREEEQGIKSGSVNPPYKPVNPSVNLETGEIVQDAPNTRQRIGYGLPLGKERQAGKGRMPEVYQALIKEETMPSDIERGEG